jgi:hypothetical protein
MEKGELMQGRKAREIARAFVEIRRIEAARFTSDWAPSMGTVAR